MASESKKEAFRKYMESSGALDSLTKVLVALYEEPDKPPAAVDFIKANLGGPTPQEYDSLKVEHEALQAKYSNLQSQYNEVLQKLDQAERALEAGNGLGGLSLSDDLKK